LANTVAECEEMVAAADKAGRMLAVGHQYRFWPSRRWIHDAVRREGPGAVRLVEVSQGQPYSWKAATGYTVRRELVSGGVLVNAGVHTVDALLWWFGDPCAQEYQDDALGGLESNFRMSLRFPSGTEVQYRQSRTCRLANEIRVHWQSGQTTIVDFSNPFMLWTIEAGERRGQNVGHDPLGFLAPGRAMYQDFVRALRGGSHAEVDGREATRVVRLIEACYREKRLRPMPPTAPGPGLTW
jgi:predicted dehydrogenase